MHPSFDALDSILAARYSYLTKGLIRYQTAFPEEWTLLQTFEDERFVYAILKHVDASVPYRARFTFLTRAENESLEAQVDLGVMRCWPRPTITIGFAGEEPARVLGEDRPAEPTRVDLGRVGRAQIWWSGPPRPGDPKRSNPLGLIWEAFLDVASQPLLDLLWDECEGLLARQGCRRCFTTPDDPAFSLESYRRLLEGRGYQTVERKDPGPLVAGSSCAVKML